MDLNTSLFLRNTKLAGSSETILKTYKNSEKASLDMAQWKI